MTKVTVILPFEENFSTKFGGAIARWVYETYRLMSLDYRVIGRIDREYSFNAPTTNKDYLLCRFIFLFPYIRRIVHRLYVFSSRKQILSSDIIHIHNSPHYIKLVRQLGFQGRIILHMHNNYFSSYTKSLIKNLEKHSFEIITCSKYLLDQIDYRSTILGNRCKVIPNGVDLDRFTPRIEELNDTIMPSILYMGRLVEGKGLIELLKACKVLSKKGIKFELSIVGSHNFGDKKGSKYIEKCKAISNSIDRDSNDVKIRWYGFLPHNGGLSEVIASSDMFVCPSICEEAFGMVIIEAMACGLPIVAYKSGGIPEVVSDFGLLVDTGDYEELAENISVLIGSYKERRRLSTLSLARSRDYSWKKVAKLFYAIVEKND